MISRASSNRILWYITESGSLIALLYQDSAGAYELALTGTFTEVGALGTISDDPDVRFKVVDDGDIMTLIDDAGTMTVKTRYP